MKFHTTPYFTPTREFNADDVLFTFQRQMDPKHPYHSVGGVYRYFESMNMRGIIKDLVKVNDYRVKFILSEPNAPFRANLAMSFASILSKEYADKMLEAKTPEKIDHQPIGTGPFVFNEYVKDTTVRLEAFKDYFSGRGRGNIETLVFAITPDANVRLQKLKANECQFIAYPAREDLESIRRDTNIKLIEQPGFNTSYVAMNTEKKPFDNKLVRQAVNHALNRDAYIQAVYLGSGQKAKSPLPPKDWAYHGDTKEYDYDVEKAKALLKKAGYSQGFETDLWVMPVSRPYMPSGRRLGEMMQVDLAKVGIRTKILTYDWPTYLDKTGKREHTLAQFGWQGDNGDPDNFLNILLSCKAAKHGTMNRAGWCYKPYDDLVTKAERETDHQERLRLYREAQVIFKEEVPWVLIAHSRDYAVMRKNVFNFKINPVGSPYYFTPVEIR